jgi:hypothetical protein
MAAARPATGMPLLQPVLTPQPSLSYSTMGSVERARLAICSAKAGGPCGRTAPSPGESGQGEHVHDLDREPLASGKLYPPLTRTVARARGPPSLLSDAPRRRARHAPEGPRSAPSCDGCAASLAASGWGEHARDVLSTPTARLEVGSSVRAVVTRERRWLVAESNGRTARTARASARRAGAAAGARHGRLRASQAPSSVART